MNIPKRHVEHTSRPSPLPSPFQGEGARSYLQHVAKMKEKLQTIVRRLLAHQEGAALATVLLLTTVILSLSIFGSRGARIELQIARNELLSKKALPIAEAGINHAFGLLKSETDFDDEVSSGIGGALAGLGSSTTLDGTSYLFKAFSGSGTSDGYYVRVEDNYDGGLQTDDSDSTIKVISRGRIGNAERIIEALIEVKTSPDCAVVSNGTLTISGNPTLAGDDGCAHSNGNSTISGSPSFTTQPTATGTMTITGNPQLNGQALTPSSNQPNISVPTVRPFNFNGLNLAAEVAALSSTGEICNNGSDDDGDGDIDLADSDCQNVEICYIIGDEESDSLSDHNDPDCHYYLLGNNCHIYWDDPSSASDTWNCTEATASCAPYTTYSEVADLTTNDGDDCSDPDSFPKDNDCEFLGWTCSENDISNTPDALWKISGNSAGNGAFFIEGWVTISGNPGSTATPWRATIIALNSINFSGNPDMEPFVTTGNLKNTLLVSGNDVEMSGNPSSDGYVGAIFAHQQIKFNGNPKLTGFAIAQCAGITWTGDPAPNDTSEKDLHTGPPCYSISGNITITYDGLDSALYPGTLTLLSWYEVRN